MSETKDGYSGGHANRKAKPMTHLIPGTIAHDFEHGAVIARFDVDGTTVKARITAEAVQDAFKVATIDGNEMQKLVSTPG